MFSFVKWIFESLTAYIQGTLNTWSGNKAITVDETDIAAKKAEADIKLGELNDQGLLKTQISTGIKDESIKIADDDKAVANAAANVAKAEAVKVETKNITPDELAAKLKDL